MTEDMKEKPMSKAEEILARHDHPDLWARYDAREIIRENYFLVKSVMEAEERLQALSDAGLEVMGWNMNMSAAPKDEGPLLGFDTVSVVHFGDPKAGRCIITWMEEDEEEDYPGEWQVQPLWEGGDIICSETNIIAWARFLSPLKDHDNGPD